MYIKPISIEEIYKDIEIKVKQAGEEKIVKAVKECDIEVDKDELIKALQYDRDQYQKGYNDALDKIRAEIRALSPKPTAEDVIDGNPIKDAVWETISDVLNILEEYKAESE